MNDPVLEAIREEAAEAVHLLGKVQWRLGKAGASSALVTLAQHAFQHANMMLEALPKLPQAPPEQATAPSVLWRKKETKA